MKKTLLFLAAMILLGCQDQTALSRRMEAIAHFLCTKVIEGSGASLKMSRSVPDVVVVGSNLPDVLQSMAPGLKTGYSVEVVRGEPGFNDPRVTHCIIIRTTNDSIMLRMRYDSRLDEFHIVGYCGAPPAATNSVQRTSHPR